MVDWAAVFVEAYLDHGTGTTEWENNSTGLNTVGISPAVTAIMTAYDGGKVMAGYGYFDNTVHFGWVIKLFGTSYVTLATGVFCAEYDKPVNYQPYVTTVMQTSALV
jgi:hypothetical protein